MKKTFLFQSQKKKVVWRDSRNVYVTLDCYNIENPKWNIELTYDLLGNLTANIEDSLVFNNYEEAQNFYDNFDTAAAEDWLKNPDQSKYLINN